MATITDVAGRAGVSMKTVSRVINGEVYVRDEVRARVNAAIADLGYQPRLAARQLAGNRSFLIALVSYDTNVSYNAAIIVAAAVRCRDRRYHLVYEPISPDDPSGDAVEQLISRLRPDGILLMPPFSEDAGLLSTIARTKTPLVRFATREPGYGMIVPMSEVEICRQLVAHLVAAGHRRIGIVTPPPGHHIAQDRVEGYRLALRDAGIAEIRELQVAGTFTFHSGVIAGETLLGMADPPTAIFATNDGMALGVISVVKRLGLRIPQDIAIAGFDDTPAGRMTFPALTTVRQPIEAMTANGIAMLLGGSDESLTPLVHKLFIRGSTDKNAKMLYEHFDA